MPYRRLCPGARRLCRRHDRVRHLGHPAAARRTTSASPFRPPGCWSPAMRSASPSAARAGLFTARFAQRKPADLRDGGVRDLASCSAPSRPTTSMLLLRAPDLGLRPWRVLRRRQRRGRQPRAARAARRGPLAVRRRHHRRQHSRPAGRHRHRQRLSAGACRSSASPCSAPSPSIVLFLRLPDTRVPGEAATSALPRQARAVAAPAGLAVLHHHRHRHGRRSSPSAPSRSPIMLNVTGLDPISCRSTC